MLIGGGKTLLSNKGKKRTLSPDLKDKLFVPEQAAQNRKQ